MGLALLHSIPGVRPMRGIGGGPDAPEAELLCYYTELFPGIRIGIEVIIDQV